MDEDAKAAYSRMADVILSMTAAANKLMIAVDELTSAVTTLTGAVGHLGKSQNHDNAE